MNLIHKYAADNDLQYKEEDIEVTRYREGTRKTQYVHCEIHYKSHLLKLRGKYELGYSGGLPYEGYPYSVLVAIAHSNPIINFHSLSSLERWMKILFNWLKGKVLDDFPKRYSHKNDAVSIALVKEQFFRDALLKHNIHILSKQRKNVVLVELTINQSVNEMKPIKDLVQVAKLVIDKFCRN